MFYVKLDETEQGPGELIAADTDQLRWSRVFISFDEYGSREVDALAAVSDKTGDAWSVAHVGELEPQHDDGMTVNYVHWFNAQTVGHLVVTTQQIYILAENGKTIDRV